MKFRALAFTTAALATVLTLSACSGTGSSGDMAGMDHGSTFSSTPSSDSAAAEFNAADIAFAQNMIPHHQGAIEMSDVVLAKEGINQRVVDLANQIKEAQAPEIEQLQTWLTAWGADEMSGDMEGMDGMDMDATELEKATGVDAARTFLEQMKVHHQGAITMAQTEIDTGANADAIDMANAIVTTQTEEISTIDSILETL